MEIVVEVVFGLFFRINFFRYSENKLKGRVCGEG